MSGAFVQAFHNSGDASTNSIQVVCTGVSAGNLLAVQVTYQSVLETVTVSDGTAYSQADIQQVGSFTQATFYRTNVGASPTITATFTNTVQFRRIQVFEYSGLSLTQATVLNAHQKNHSATFGTGADAVTSNTAATNVDGCTICGFAYDDTSTTLPTQGTSFTSHDGFTNAAGDCMIGEDRVQTTQGSVAATFTTTAGTDDIYVAMMAFVPAAGGGPAPILMGQASL